MDTTNWSTGDLLAFSGSGLYDTLIKWWTRSQFTHVGMLDMTVESVPVLIQATPAHGVGPMVVDRAIQEEGGNVFWVAVKQDVAKAIDPTYQADLLGFMRKHYGDQYDWGGIGHFVFPFIKQAKNREFCSELIAMAFNTFKLMHAPLSKSPGQVVAQPIFREAVPVHV